MEFLFDNPNIEIKIDEIENKNKNDNILSPFDIDIKLNNNNENGMEIEENGEEEKEIIENQDKNNLTNYTLNLFFKLDDYYLVNQIKIMKNNNFDKNIKINDIKFKNINTKEWEEAYYYAPDTKDIILDSNESITIFSVGLTNNIHLSLLINEIEKNQKDLILKEIKDSILKIIIHSQYIYSIPNSTILMTLLNLKNYFLNYSSYNHIPIEEQPKSIIHNYLCSLFLTSIAMIQSRLYIQSSELLKTLQNFILQNQKNVDVINFCKIFFEIDKSETEIIKICIIKIELVKSLCMFEHGHIHIFLNCLKHCVKVNDKNDYSWISETVSFNKVNELVSDKYYIQNFLQKYGDKISDLITRYLTNKSEIIKFSILKIVEFIIDYNPLILFKYLDNIVYFLFKTSYYTNDNFSKNNNNQNSMNVNCKLSEVFEENEIIFPQKLYESFISNNSKPHKLQSKEIFKENSKNKNSISQVLQKQINYTILTITTNIPSFDDEIIINILDKVSSFLFEILRTTDKDNVVYIFSINLLKKCYETITYNISTNDLISLFILGLKNNIKDLFKEYLSFQTITNSNKVNRKSSKEAKESIQAITAKNNVMNTLCNTSALIENSKIGNLLILILDKVSDYNINSDNSIFIDIAEYISTLIFFLKDDEVENENEKDFAIFYLYLLLELCLLVNFPNEKLDIKRRICELSKYESESQNEVNVTTMKFIEILFNLENFTLFNKKSYILFEITLDILTKIKMLYDTNNEIFSYEKFFLPQYKSLNVYLENGIFSDNIQYLIKTIPLCEMKNDEFIIAFKNIFSKFLKNFENFYTEESFLLSTQFLDKIKFFIDKAVFEEITQAIVNKSHYKGNPFKQYYNKYFELIFDFPQYFQFLIETIITQLNQYIENVSKYKENKTKFKTFYVKFIDFLEIIRKFYEFVKNKNVEDEDIDKYSLFNNKNIIELIISTVKIADDTVISKIDSLINENLNLYEFDAPKDNENEMINKIFLIANTLSDYFKEVNKRENIFLFSENLNLMIKMINLFIKFDDFYSEKTQLFLKYFDSLNLDFIDKIKLKPVYHILMNLYEIIIIPIQYIQYLENDIKKGYSSMLIEIFTHQFKSSDEIKNYFALEMILKLFSIEIFCQEVTLNLELIAGIKNYLNQSFEKEELSWIDILFDKIIKFLKHKNFKIVLLCHFIISLLVPENMHSKFDEKIKLIIKDFTWISNQEILDLYFFIREKIRFPKKSQKKPEDYMKENSFYPIDNKGEYDKKEINVDEIDDDDENEEENEEDEILDSDELIQKEINKNKNENNKNEITTNNNQNNSNVNNKNKNIESSSKDDDDNLTLEDLGVVEVDDNIFDNFDEANIPVLKKNRERCKGYTPL